MVEIFKPMKQINEAETLDSATVPLEERKRLLLELDRSNKVLGVYFKFRLLFYFFLDHKTLRSLNRPIKVLEVGSGSGGLGVYLLNHKIFRDLPVEYTLFDLDPHILNWAKQRAKEQGLELQTRVADQAHLEKISSQEFDFVLSLQMLHHIHPKEIMISALREMSRVARLGVFCIDLERRRSALPILSLITPLIRLDRGLRQDGIRSVLRSYTTDEVRSVLPDGFKIRRLPIVPFFVISRRSSGDF